MAQTHKDMLQWVSYINKAHDILNNKQTRMKKISEEEYIDIVEKPNIPLKEQQKTDSDDDDTYNSVVKYEHFLHIIIFFYLSIF